MSHSRIRFALLAAALMLPVLAQAAPSPQTGSFQVSAQVNSSCQVVSTTNIAFGTYDPLAVADLDAAGSVTVRCSQGTSNVLVALDQGANAAAGSTASVPARQMASGADRLAYQVYSNAARSTVWGDNVASGVTIAGPMAAASPVVLTTYGRIAAGADTAAGAYVDTVGVTVTF